MKTNNGEVIRIYHKLTSGHQRMDAHMDQLSCIKNLLLKNKIKKRTYYLSGSTLEIIFTLKLFNFILDSNKICNAISGNHL